MQSQLTLIAQNILGIFVFGLLLLLIYVNGSWLLRFFRIEPHSKAEEIGFAFVLGLLLAQFITLFIGLAGLLYSVLFQALFLILLIIQRSSMVRAIKPLPGYLLQSGAKAWKQLGHGRNLFHIVLYFVLIRFAVIYFFGALSPEVESDAMTYHLGALRLYVDQNRIFPLDNLYFSNFPFGMEMLFLLGWMIQDVFVGKLFHFAIPVLSILAITAFCKRYIDSKVGLLAAVIFYTCPAVGLSSKSAYVDGALGYATFLSVYALLNFAFTNRIGWVYISAVCTGLAMTIKYTGLNSMVLGFLILGLITVFGSREKLSSRILKNAKSCVVIAFIAIAIYSPWAVKNYFYIDNPVFPFFSTLFPNAYMSDYFERTIIDTTSRMGRETFDRPLQFLFNVTHGREFGDWSIGPFFFWLMPFVFFVWWKNRAIKYVFIAALTGCIIWYIQSPQSRLLLPYCAFFSILVSYVVIQSEGKRFLEGSMKIVVVILLAQIWMPTWDWYPQAIFGNVSREAFLADHFPGYGYMNKHLPAGAQVLALSNPNQFLTTHKIWEQDTSLGGRQLAEDLYNAGSHESKMGQMEMTILEDVRAKYIKFTKNLSDEDWWWLNEICVECRNEQGRITKAQPFSFETDLRKERASRAIDSILITTWDSAEVEKPGMSSKLRLREPCFIHKITYYSKQWESPEYLDIGLSNDGIHWQTVEHSSFRKVFSVTPEMVRSGMASLKREGIEYLYWEARSEQGFYLLMTELERNEKLYGLKLLYKKDVIRLYEFESLPLQRKVCEVNFE